MIQFGYARVECPASLVGAALVRELVASQFQGYSGLRGVPLTDVSGLYVLAEAPGDGSYLWERAGDNTQLYEGLSRRLDSTLRIIDVDEDVRRFLYLRYHSGTLVHRRLEPERLFVSPVVDLRDVEYGPRRIETAAAFLGELESEFVPDLVMWHFGQWADPEWRKEIFGLAGNPVARAVELDLTPARRAIRFIGKWSNSERTGWKETVAQ